ncbi:DUF4864 domain-containing protein [Limnobacter humi]|uniref:DUF4864 domain-containing protein n=1 Tax=Limnobacter humi TaxID=1778671 RepID=A0ABT1WJM4_9BURK|nr:DUF4864 domain-containing protein [Limnobacter humi]MCQ8897723.1 DUF4864 domain-containing protein [Limnobacter humi]
MGGPLNKDDGVFKTIWKWWLLVFALGLAAAFANKATAAEPPVKRDYNVVYRPASVKFVGFERNGRQVVHSVQMIDQSQVLWNVYYLLEKLPQGGWRIFSCDIEKAATDLI